MHIAFSYSPSNFNVMIVAKYLNGFTSCSFTWTKNIVIVSNKVLQMVNPNSTLCLSALALVLTFSPISQGSPKGWQVNLAVQDLLEVNRSNSKQLHHTTLPFRLMVMSTGGLGDQRH